MIDPERSRFPDPRGLPGDAPFARGVDYRPEILVDAYAHGIFPWPDGDEVYWWSPDPRAVITLDGLHISRSLRRTLRRGWFSCTTDRAFEQVVRACAQQRADGTWITPDYIDAYVALHHLGHAHSVEVWEDEDLVGGVYGVTIGALFTGESMFHRRSDASKVALVALRDHLAQCGFGIIDVQLPTPHLATMGAIAVQRSAYLDLIADLVRRPVSFA